MDHSLPRLIRVCLSLVVLLVLVSCGGGSGAQPPAPPPIVTVTVSPSQPWILPQGGQTFSAQVQGSSNTSVTWSIQEAPQGGAIGSSGQYQAPASLGTYHVVATSVVNPSCSGKAAVRVSRFTQEAGPQQSHGLGVAVRLLDGRILFCGGYQSANCEIYNPTTGTSTSAGSLTEVRNGHCATLLPDGRVLVTGGLGLKSAEVFNPATGTSQKLPDMAVIRYRHASVLLRTGKVLLAGTGGRSASLITELFDPVTNAFVRTGDLGASRTQPAAVLLGSGQIMISGGFQDEWPDHTRATVECYDPSNGMWMSANAMSGARAYHSVTLLRDGRVLVAGGVDENFNSVATAEIFDPGTGTFSAPLALPGRRDSHMASLLTDGSVLLLGGSVTNTTTSGSSTSTVANGLVSFDRYDPGTGAFVAGDESTPDAFQGSGGLQVDWPDGLPRFFFGTSRFTYYPSTTANGIKVLLPLPAVSVPCEGTLLVSAVVTGATDPKVDWAVQEGSTGGTVTPAGLYTAPTSAGTFHLTAASHEDPTKTATLQIQVQASTVTLTIAPNAVYLLSGGTLSLSARVNGNVSKEVSWELQEGPSAGVLDATGKYTAPAVGGLYHAIATSLWGPSVRASATLQVGKTTGFASLAMPAALHSQSAVPLLDGTVLVTGGGAAPDTFGTDAVSAKAYLFNPASGAFTDAGTLVSPRLKHAGVILPTGKVLLTGGQSVGGYYVTFLQSCESYAPGSGFLAGPTLSDGWGQHMSLRLPDGRIFLWGRDNFGTVPAILDPATGNLVHVSGDTGVSFGASGTQLQDGRILLVGNGPGAYLFDPATGALTNIAPTTSYGSTMGVRLLDGRILLIHETRADLFDPATGAFTPTGSPVTGRTQGRATLLANGKVLVTGGLVLNAYTGLAACDLYDPGAGVFSSAMNLPQGRYLHAPVLLADGRVALFGGAPAYGTDYGSSGLANVCVFDTPTPAAPSVTVLPEALCVVPGGAEVLRGICMGTGSNLGLTWTIQEGAAGGTVTAQGVYTAPAMPGTYHVIATSQADPTASGSAVVVVK